jgi:hypothetical protein
MWPLHRRGRPQASQRSPAGLESWDSAVANRVWSGWRPCRLFAQVRPRARGPTGLVPCRAAPPMTGAVTPVGAAPSTLLHLTWSCNSHPVHLLEPCLLRAAPTPHGEPAENMHERTHTRAHARGRPVCAGWRDCARACASCVKGWSCRQLELRQLGDVRGARSGGDEVHRPRPGAAAVVVPGGWRRGKHKAWHPLRGRDGAGLQARCWSGYRPSALSVVKRCRLVCFARLVSPAFFVFHPLSRRDLTRQRARPSQEFASAFSGDRLLIAPGLRARGP